MGYLDADALKVVAHGVALDDRVDKGQAAALAPEAALAYAGKVAVLVEAVTLELGHHTAVLHLAVLHDQVKEELPHGRSLVDVAEAVHFHHLGYGEEGPRVEPARYVVAAGVVVERLGRYLEDVVLQPFQVVYGHDLLARGGVAEDEVAKAEVVHHRLAQVDGQRLGVLVEEGAVQLAGLLAVFAVARLDDDGQVGVVLLYPPGQLQAGMHVLAPVVLEGDIAYHPQHVVVKLLVEPHGFLVVARQHHLGAPSHAQHGLVPVECLGRERLRLPQDELVERGQYRRVEAHRVLDEQYHLYAHLRDVVLGVHLVLDELDDGHQQVDVAQPRKHIVDPGEVLVLQPQRHLAGEGCEHHKGHVRI